MQWRVVLLIGRNLLVALRLNGAPQYQNREMCYGGLEMPKACPGAREASRIKEGEFGPLCMFK